MIERSSKFSQLSSQQLGLRLGFIGVLGFFLVALHALEPGRIPRWIPLQTSCGAITGLPCLFCGTTRALHYVLNGDLSRALYFNWLAFPILAAALLAGAWWSSEIVSGRRLFISISGARFTGQTAMLSAFIVASLWLLQVYLAVSQHKTELLNPAGPLYRLFVK